MGHRARQWAAWSVPLMLLLTALAETRAAANADPVDRYVVGQADPREDYTSMGFQTRSTPVPETSGVRLDLAALAADPPLGLPPLEKPPVQAEIDLGRRLFYDRRLSANQTLSCGICHVPEQAFAQNELATPVGIEGHFVRRNAPSLYNVGYRPRLFHDGRETSLSKQIFSPLTAPNEMGNASPAAVLERIAVLSDYRTRFEALFDEGLSADTLGRVLAAYQRALLSADSPFDRWFYRGDTDALSQDAKAGFFLFDSVGCGDCHTFSHSHAHFTDDAFHRTGIEVASREREARPQPFLQVAPGVTIPLAVSIPAPDRNDLGLEEVTGSSGDRFRYRTPSLRNVALTAPYMHDGSLTSLMAVVDFYAGGVEVDPDRDPRLVPLDLTAGEKRKLVAFLESLTGSNVAGLALDARSVAIGERGAPAAPTDTNAR